jgi:hypothetical protein
MINNDKIFSSENYDFKNEQSQEGLLQIVGAMVLVPSVLKTVLLLIRLIVAKSSRSQYEKTYKKLVEKMSKTEQEELNKIILDVSEFVIMFSRKITTVCEKVYKTNNVAAVYNHLDPKNVVYINPKYTSEKKKNEMLNSSELEDVKKEVNKRIEEVTAAILKCIIVGKVSKFGKDQNIMSVTCVTNGYNETERIATAVDKTWASVFNSDISSGSTTFNIHGKNVNCIYKTVIYGNDNHLYSSLEIKSVN